MFGLSKLQMILGGIAALIVFGLLTAAVVSVRGAYAAKAQLPIERARAEKAEREFGDYRATTERQIAEFTARQAEDQKADAALGERIARLETVAGELARVARSIPSTVEKRDANGVTRVAINSGWWLCRSSILTRDPTDTAACLADSGDVKAEPRGPSPGVQVPPRIRKPQARGSTRNAR